MWWHWWLVGLVAAECDIDQAAYLQAARVKVSSLIPSHKEGAALVALDPSETESPAAGNASEATSPTPLTPLAAESPAAEAASPTPLTPLAAESPAARNASEAASPVSALATVTGGVDGDPHVHTLDGKHYTLLREGTFSLWHFSGYNSTFFSSTMMENRSVEVDWQIYVHYAGGHSFAKGLLLRDQTLAQKPRVTLEFTAEKCHWRQRIHEDWSPVVKATDVFVPDGADYVTGFKFTENPHNKGMKDLHFRMNSKNGILQVATLKVACHPGSHINTRLVMHDASLANFVQGQLGPARNLATFPAQRRAVVNPPSAESGRRLDELMSTLQSEDEEYLVKREWMQLGGSRNAAHYLKDVDLGSSEVKLLSCDEGQEQQARRLCRKHLGPSRELAPRNTWRRNIFEDCVFDICAGAGEATAEMALEIGTA